MKFGAFPLHLDVKHFKHLPNLPRWKISLICFILFVLIFIWHFLSIPADDTKYLYARAQSNREQHQKTGLLQQMEENQQSTETTPQNYKQRGGRQKQQLGQKLNRFLGTTLLW